MTQPGIPEIDLKAPFNEAFVQIGRGIEQCVDRFNEIVDKVRRWFWTLPPPVLLWVRERLTACRDMVETVIAKALHAIDHHLPVLSLINTSFAWLDQVKRPISGISAIASRAEKPGRWNWSGDAERAYSAKVAEQQAAVDDVTGKADFISGWLFGIARANVDYAVELARVVTQLAGRLTEATIEIGSVIAIPWAVEALAEALGELVKAGLDNLLTIAERFVDAVGNVRDVHAQLADHAKLPGGIWPEAVRG